MVLELPNNITRERKAATHIIFLSVHFPEPKKGRKASASVLVGPHPVCTKGLARRHDDRRRDSAQRAAGAGHERRPRTSKPVAGAGPRRPAETTDDTLNPCKALPS
ncbi:hypothetical protein EVAR_66972_1 [Eumeta japonica]|uniref:Uncharacterized protein n=1 Tax=Eumeta variegata TaxID=151549 RepID=A0A4C2A1I8_EUMVA|nr:hypothetical protein EVAR_66972_1 [Eumeta japonica]